jgi:hypothetical protein
VVLLVCGVRVGCELFLVVCCALKLVRRESASRKQAGVRFVIMVISETSVDLVERSIGRARKRCQTQLCRFATCSPWLGVAL